MTRLFAGCGLVVSTILATGVHAEPWSNAKCVRELWTRNTRQQSPCLVSAYLGAPCVSNDWGVEALDMGDSYGLPARLANPCLCNTVLWNLLSACSLCQGGSSISWSVWTANCSVVDINIGKYPLPIPVDTAVPHWAYYDFTTTGLFSPTTASQQLGLESTAQAIATATSSASPKPPQPTTTPQSQSANNTGAIIGGTVGGVLGLAVIGLIAFVVVRKGKKDPEPTSHYPQHVQGGHNLQVGTHPNAAAPMMAQSQPQPGRPGMASAPSTGSGSSYKHNDQNDVSTSRSGTNLSCPPTPYTGSLPYSSSPQHQARPGGYTGAPQV